MGKTRETCGKNKFKTNRILQFMFVIGLYVFQCLMKFTVVGESLAVVCVITQSVSSSTKFNYYALFFEFELIKSVAFLGSFCCWNKNFQ